MIAYKFPPMHNTSCVRTWSFHQHIKKYFDTVTVISTSNRHLLRKEFVDLGNAVIHDAKTYDYRTAFQKGEKRQSVLKDTSKESPLGKFAQKLSASYPSLLLFGEGGIRYINSAIRIGRKLVQEKSITHIFSTFSPYADHIIAKRLKSEFSSLFWIADFRDLHVDPTQDNMLFRNLQKKWNRRVLKKANIITTVSAGLAVHLKEYNSNVYVLRNGIERMSQATHDVYSDKFTISYTGSMYGDRRDPDLLLLALSELIQNGELSIEKIRITYAGKDSEVWKRKVREHDIEEILDDRNLISRKETINIQHWSSVNVLLTYSSEELTGNLTGKVFEYLNAKRPVLILINGPIDMEIEDLVNGDLGIVAYSDDLKMVKEFLVSEFGKWKNGKTSNEGVDYANALRPFLWESMVEEFVEHIELNESCNS